MTPTQTLRIISFLNLNEPSVQSDLAWLAVRQVRALVNAGMRVQWQILTEPQAIGSRQVRTPEALPLAAIDQMAQHDARLADVPALARQTLVGGDADVLLAVTSPEWWAPLLTGGARRIVYLERNLHWPQHVLRQLCASCDEVWLPDEAWADVVREAGDTLAVVVPPIRQHRTGSHVAQERQQALQSSLGIVDGSFVFLCEFDSQARQACSHLLAAWGQAFGQQADIDVALVLYCPPQFIDPQANSGRVDAADWVERYMAQPMPDNVVLLDQKLNAEGEDLLRACAHALVVTSEGDGLGLRVMDAVDAGNAVVGPAMQGLEPLLGPKWQGFDPTTGAPAAIAAALAQALRDCYDRVFDEGPRRAMVQWHVANHLSEAAFAQRVLQRLPALRSPA